MFENQATLLIWFNGVQINQIIYKFRLMDDIFNCFE